MNQDYRSALKDALVLIVITLVAGLMLGGVYQLTKEPIEKQKALALAESCKAVFPVEDGFVGADHFMESTYKLSDSLAADLLSNGVTVGNIYEAYTADNQLIGYAIEVTSAEGYGGDIRLMCGVSESGILRGVSILEISETAGLGMRAESVLVPQIHNMNVTEIRFTKTGKTADNEIDAISGATITTTAFTNIVNASLDVYYEISEGKEAQ